MLLLSKEFAASRHLSYFHLRINLSKPLITDLSHSYLVMHSEVKSEAWVEDKVTQVEAQTAKTTWANIIKNDVEVETAEKTQGEKAACHQHLGPQR